MNKSLGANTFLSSVMFRQTIRKLKISNVEMLLTIELCSTSYSDTLGITGGQALC